MQTNLLNDPALVHFMDVIKMDATNRNDVIERMEDHFMNECANRVYDAVWMELGFEFIKLKRATNNEDISHEKSLKELCTQILELSDLRTGFGSSSDIMAKTIPALRRMKAFELVYRNAPKQLQALRSALRSCTLEAD